MRRVGGRAAVLALASLLAVLALLAAHSSWPQAAAGAQAELAAFRLVVLAAVFGLATLLALIVTLGFVARERLRRRRSERQLSRLLQGAEQTDSLVTVVSARGRIQYVNPAVELCTGYSRSELVGRRWPSGFPWYADQRTASEARQVLLSGGTFRGPVPARRKDGAPLVIEEHLAPLRDGSARARFLSTARDVTQERLSADRLAFLTAFDPLTALPNRGHFADLLHDRLARRPPAEQPLAVLVMDVDRFRHLNDLLTPQQGDAVLRHLAEALRSFAGSQGIVGRLGNDEFGLIQPLAADDDVLALAHAARRALAQHAGGDARGLPITLTVGLARCPQDGVDATTLLKNASLALARAKTQGRDSIQLFSRELSVQALEAYSMQRRLASALDNGEYRVHYQPYCDLASGRISGAEALIRWESADLGSVAPLKFIPALEESGQIIEVGEWVLRRVCRQIREWRESSRPVPVAVNLSQLQLGQHDVVEMVRDAVEEHAIEPSRLTLELTETSCVRDLDFAIARLHELKEVGITISVDDFGTGYSSLSNVKKLPVDQLKIDMSFVRDVTSDPDAASIITAITSMARSLGLKTIAEGVETEAQRNVLRLLRCDLGQGFHFGPAVAAEAFDRLEGTPPPGV